MRVTNSMLVSNFLSNLNTNMNKLNKLQDQMATNKKYAHVSDDPISVIYSQQANYKLKRLAQYQSNVSHAIEWNTQVETSMMDLNKILKSAYENTIGAATDYKTKSDLQKDAEYIKQLRDQVITTLNSTFGDKYIFGGYNNNGYVSAETGKLVPPFSCSEDGKTLLFNGVPVNDIANGTFREKYDNAMTVTVQGMIGDAMGGSYPTVTAGPPPINQEHIDAMETMLGEIVSGKFDDAAYTQEEGLRIQKLASDILASKSDNVTYDATYFTDTYGATTAAADLGTVVGQIAEGNGYDATMIEDLKKLASDTLSFDIGPGISMDANYNGISLAMVPGTGTNIYEILNGLYDTLMFEGQEEIVDEYGNVLQEAKDLTTADDVNKHIKILQDGQSRILSAMAEIGGRTNRLDMMESRYGQDEISYKQMKSDAEDADQAEVIMNAKMAEAVYKAALSTGASIIQPTLMDFLR